MKKKDTKKTSGAVRKPAGRERVLNVRPGHVTHALDERGRPVRMVDFKIKRYLGAPDGSAAVKAKTSKPVTAAKLSPYVLCIRSDTHLQVGKVYHALPGRRADRVAEAHGLVRVIDDEGEDYLHPRACFLAIKLSPTIERLIRERDRA